MQVLTRARPPVLSSSLVTASLFYLLQHALLLPTLLAHICNFSSYLARALACVIYFFISVWQYKFI